MVRRIFVEKKADFAIKARELKEEMSIYHFRVSAQLYYS